MRSSFCVFVTACISSGSARDDRRGNGEERRDEADERDHDVIDALGLERVETARGEIAAEKSAGVREVVDAAHHESEEAENERVADAPRIAISELPVRRP